MKPYDILQVKNASYFVPEYPLCHLVVPCETLSCEVRAVPEETIDDQTIQFIDVKVYEISLWQTANFAEKRGNRNGCCVNRAKGTFTLLAFSAFFLKVYTNLKYYIDELTGRNTGVTVCEHVRTCSFT
jgi:hypothetical protein